MSVPKSTRLNLSQSPIRLRGGRGFTMIEIMIVVAIIGILASIAFPSYTEYIRKSQVAEAPTVLSDMRTKMEQYYLDNRNYGTAGGACGVVITNNCPTGQVCSYFNYSCTMGATNQTYTLTATGKAGRPSGHTYTVNEANVRQTTAFGGPGSPTLPANCWLIGGKEC